MKRVYVLMGNFCEDTWVEGVFETTDTAIGYLKGKANEENQVCVPGVCGTYDIGLDWYSIKPFDVQ